MDYSSIAQTEHDAALDGSPLMSPARRNYTTDLPSSPRPLPALPSGEEGRDENDGIGLAGGVIAQSIASSRPCGVVKHSRDSKPFVPEETRKLETQNASLAIVDSPSFMQSEFEETPARTASISRNLPLSHPRPDLQSMQGAYIRNVERLEESAERLSMTSSLDDELQKMKLEQRGPQRQSSAPTRPGISPHLHPSRQFSNGSQSNSIAGVNAAARSGGYSPSGYVSASHDPFRSGSWSQASHPSRRTSNRSLPEAPEPVYEGRPLDIMPDASTFEDLYNDAAQSVPESDYTGLHRLPSNASADRPGTSASNDTYRQATSLFRDFDGVHYSSSSRQASLARQISLDRPPLASDSRAYREPQPGQHMVFYPAPVPAMLNLPQKLSKMSAADRERRRLQALGAMPEELRKSAAWLQADGNNLTDPRRSRQTLAGLPPQLRASAFFDHSGVRQDIKLQGGSATATLDDILDASAYAPVSAFTDHPIVGQLGKEVYGKDIDRESVQMQDIKFKEKKAKRMSSLSNMLGTGRRVSEARSMTNSARIVSRESKASELEARGINVENSYLRSDDLESIARKSISPDEDELSNLDGSEADSDHSVAAGDDQAAAYVGAPTTLLAELQMRKAQQKQRNRTAADAFPNGMHSTLLELDAVTQLQQKSRKQKHITLAWEDHEETEMENFDDEDVPLGVLFPGKEGQMNANRPIGLLEKRDMEDNEPLAQRRARLTGDQPLRHPAGSKFTLDSPGLSIIDVAEQEGETLAQRLRRLRAEKERSVGVNNGAVLSQSGLNIENVPPPSKTPDTEETLGQRRKRLQVGSASRQVSGGSAHLGLDRPVLSSAQPTNDSRIPSYGSAGAQNAWQSNNHLPMLPMPYQTPHVGMPNGYLPPPAMPTFGQVQPQMPFAYGTYNSPPIFSPNMAAMQMQMSGYGHPSGYGAGMGWHQQQPMMPIGMGPPLESKQRDSVERWRQSVA